MKARPLRQRKAGVLRSAAVLFVLGGTAAMISTLSIRPIGAQPGRFRDMDQTNGRSGGSRGCALAAPPSDILPAQPALILLASQPGNTVRTRSQHPTFAWYIRDQGDWPLAFRIYRQSSQEAPKTLVVDLKHKDFISRQGIMSLSLPKTYPPLEPGETYIWQVVMQCEPDNSSSRVFAQSTLEIIAPLGPEQSAVDREHQTGEQHRDRTDERFNVDDSTIVPMPHRYDSDIPATFHHDALNLWLRDRLHGHLTSKRFSWEQLGMSAAEATELERSPVNWVSPWE